MLLSRPCPSMQVSCAPARAAARAQRLGRASGCGMGRGARLASSSSSFQASVRDQPPPPPQRTGRRGRREVATGRRDIAAAGRGRQREREAGEKDTKTVSERPEQPRAYRRPGPGEAWARRAWNPGNLTSRGRQRPGELRTRGLRGQSISVPHFRPAPAEFPPIRGGPAPAALLPPSHWLQACLPPSHLPSASHSSSASAARGWGSFARAPPPTGFLVLFFLPHPFPRSRFSGTQ